MVDQAVDVAGRDPRSGRVSVLFADGARDGEPDGRPGCFADLNLDQVVDAVTAGRQEYRLEPFFAMPLDTPEEIAYRHEVFDELDDPALRATVETFQTAMRAVRTHRRVAGELRHPRQRQLWLLDAVVLYCGAVERLAGDLACVDLRSRAFRAVLDHLAAHVASSGFRMLAAEARRIRAALDAVEYCLALRSSSIRVSRYADEPDHAAAVEATFAKFRQDTERSRPGAAVREPVEMNHVEAQILDQLARLYPRTFGDLAVFCDRNRVWLDETVARFDREVQFYLAYREVVARLTATGLPFCFPEVGPSKEIRATDTADLALALSLAADQLPVVRGEFHLDDPERVVVVSGPNQGGKTTFARTFGQLHVLGRLGCPVPGRTARLLLYDKVFTHFERSEDITDLRSKLEDDLVRLREILSRATPRSIVILNEAFASTALQDAVLLGRRILERVVRLDLLCVCVTFVDELASLGPTTVSMASTVDPHDPAERTYRVVRRRADGRVHAVAIAEKHGLTDERLKGRIPS